MQVLLTKSNYNLVESALPGCKDTVEVKAVMQKLVNLSRKTGILSVNISQITKSKIKLKA